MCVCVRVHMSVHMYVSACTLPSYSHQCLSFFPSTEQKITPLKCAPVVSAGSQRNASRRLTLLSVSCIHHGLPIFLSVFRHTWFCLGHILPAVIAKNPSHFIFTRNISWVLTCTKCYERNPWKSSIFAHAAIPLHLPKVYLCKVTTVEPQSLERGQVPSPHWPLLAPAF